MTAPQEELKELLKKRLFASIGTQIDLIAYVPNDIDEIVRNFKFDTEAVGQAPEDIDFVNSSAAQCTTDVTLPEAQILSEREQLARQVNHYYDQAFYSRDGLMGLLLGESEYRNIGYWSHDTKTQHEASERLQDALLGFIPLKMGRILDVACGMGASTRRLLNHYPPENIWAINISAKQIESTLRNAPGCHAQVMNAVDLKFEDEFFDNILCIEAAFHFETRRKFLEDSHRVLKTGGRLVLSDTLFTSRARLEQYTVFPSPLNHLETADEYRKLLAEVGFKNIIIQDVTQEVWGGHFLHVINLIHREFYHKRLNIVQMTEILWTYYQLNAITGLCLFVSAEK
jgi:cyclopropane fatty-acyl-phospholipid synthase-like methyltransferase